MESISGFMDPLITPSVSIKRGMGSSGNGRNWPLPCFLVAMSGVTKNVIPNPSWKGLVGLFIGESFFNMVSCSIPTNGSTC